jgi:hypothetical protein
MAETNSPPPIPVVKQQPWWFQGVVDVLRGPPATVVSIFVALVLARFALGIDFSHLSSITKDGVTFATKDDLDKTNAAIQSTDLSVRKRTQIATADVAAQVQALEGRFAALETVDKGKSKGPSVGDAADVASIGRVSDSVAALGMPDPELKQGANVGVDGYIWIGSMAVGAKTLSPQNLTGVADPSQVAVGQQLKVLANLSVRQSPPSEVSGSDAANAAPSLAHASPLVGVVPKGATVTIEELPQPVRRTKNLSYWTHVKVN